MVARSYSCAMRMLNGLADLAEEAEARYAGFLAGRTTAVDGDDVFARAYSRVRGR